MGLKETRNINVFNADDDLKYSGLSVWKNNILMVNIDQRVSDQATGSNTANHQYVLPLLKVNTEVADTQNTIDNSSEVEPLQHLQLAVDEHQTTLLNQPSSLSLADDDYDQQDQSLLVENQPEHAPAGDDFSEDTASNTLDLDLVSELDRYHQDYDQEKTRIRAIVEQDDLESSAATAAIAAQVELPEAYIDDVLPMMREEAITAPEAPVISEEAVIDTAAEAPMLSEGAVTDTETEAPTISEEAITAPETEAPVISEEAITAPETEASVLSEETVTDTETEAPAISEEAVTDTATEAAVLSEEALIESEVVIAHTAALQSEPAQDLVQHITHPQHDAVEAALLKESIDLDGLNLVDTANNHEALHRPLDHQDEENHQKIIDTYRQIIEMYK